MKIDYAVNTKYHTKKNRFPTFVMCQAAIFSFLNLLFHTKVEKA